MNVDPLNPTGCPSAETLTNMGCRWVRLVSRRGVEWYIDQCHASGLKVLAAIGRESEGYVVPGADLYEVGNEPDLDSPSSWTMSPDEFMDLWAWFKSNYPELPAIVGGLASGQLGWWQAVAPRIWGAVGLGVHPYAKTAAEAREYLRALKSIRADLPLFVTEWQRPVEEILEFVAMLREEAEAAMWFCWSDGMVDGFGVVDAQGRAKPELFALQGAQVADIDEIEGRLHSEEQRNQWLVEWLWRFGDGASTDALRSHALRLASACDPGQGARPRNPNA